MDDFSGARVRARLLTGGYAQAYDRFEEAQRDIHAEPAFFALFEALNWAHAIDDVIAKLWTPDGEKLGYGWRNHRALGNGEELAYVMDGLRYVRNRVHHQWADALAMEDGTTIPFTIPSALVTWAWRPAERLPAPADGHDDPRGLDAYTMALAGRRADDALVEMSRAFAFIGQLLDPPVAPRKAPVVDPR